MKEREIEELATIWLEKLGWSVRSGPDIAPDGPYPERCDYSTPFLSQRLRQALYRLNPSLPAQALDEALRQVTNPSGASLEERNRSFHRLLVDGVPVEYRRDDGTIATDRVHVLDFDDADNNDWLAVTQFSLYSPTRHRHRRLDTVLFVNGLPLVVCEWKAMESERPTIGKAYSQLQTYKAELSDLFALNELLVISDGADARLGTLTAGQEWFKPWADPASEAQGKFENLVGSALDRATLLELVRHFILFEEERTRLDKKVAGYHQFFTVRAAIAETLRAVCGRPSGRLPAAGRPGDRRIGVVWHTQGSGKSLTMVFYAARLAREAELNNPTIVVLTDRNDLDDQLFGTFTRCRELLRQEPEQAESRADLRKKLNRQYGGIVFTTIQKFLLDEDSRRRPLISDRNNIIVIADEAHRSQYGFIAGLAGQMRKALPNASFIAFTGTPIELDDRDTRAVFGDYIDIYDMRRAIEDGATVPIYYESRLAELELAEDERPHIDEEFEEITEQEEEELVAGVKERWTSLEAVVGAAKRLDLLAQDIVAHFESRLRLLDGKGMVVCMSRRICVGLYERIVKLRPEWHSDDDEKGVVKVVMTGAASDPPEWQQHVRDKKRRERLAERFKDEADPFKLVIVRDMWLTGFDCPSLHTMYIDKPMRGHNLMQAIARVNRVFGSKPGGLAVDYIGLLADLKEALATYSESGGQEPPVHEQAEAVAEALKHYEVCLNLLHGYDWSGWAEGTTEERYELIQGAAEHILVQEEGADRFIEAARKLARFFVLAMPHEGIAPLQDNVAFLQAVLRSLVDVTALGPAAERDMDAAVAQLVSKAIAPQGVISLIDAHGLAKPDISLLSEEFLEELRTRPQKHVSARLLEKLVEGEISRQRRVNLVRARTFSQMLQATLAKYHNRAIDTVQMIEELIALARYMREQDKRGEELGLSEEELAFYDALETNDSAVQVLGDEVLCQIARELAETVRTNATVDWTVRENVRANLRRLVKRALRRHKYPPDKQERATQLVLEQAETLSEFSAKTL